jgi:hypothetical protein
VDLIASLFSPDFGWFWYAIPVLLVSVPGALAATLVRMRSASWRVAEDSWDRAHGERIRQSGDRAVRLGITAASLSALTVALPFAILSQPVPMIGPTPSPTPFAFAVLLLVAGQLIAVPLMAGALTFALRAERASRQRGTGLGSGFEWLAPLLLTGAVATVPAVVTGLSTIATELPRNPVEASAPVWQWASPGVVLLAVILLAYYLGAAALVLRERREATSSSVGVDPEPRVGGWLLVLCGALILFVPLVGLADIAFLVNVAAAVIWQGGTGPGFIESVIVPLALQVILAGAGCYVGLGLLLRTRGAVGRAKVYFLAAAVAPLVGLALQASARSTIPLAGVPLPTLALSISCYAYLTWSKRVLATYIATESEHPELVIAVPEPVPVESDRASEEGVVVDQQELAFRLRTWVQAGIISPQQADEIRLSEATHSEPYFAPSAHDSAVPAQAAAAATQAPEGLSPSPALPASTPVPERRPVPAAPAPASAAQRRLPFLGEALGYIGAAFAVAALGTLGLQNWTTMMPAVQIALTVVISCVLVGGGAVLSRIKVPAAQRLASALLFAGTVAIGCLAFLAVINTMPTTGGGTRDYLVRAAAWRSATLAGACTAFLVGTAIWFFRRTALQLVAVTVALWVFLWTVFLPSGDFEFAGLWLVGIGVVWLLTAELGVLKPRTAAWVMGSLSLFWGLGWVGTIGSDAGTPMMYQFWSTATAVGGVLVGIAMIAFAVVRDRGIAMGMGSLAIVLFVPQVMFSVLGGLVAWPIVLLVVAVLLVGMSVALIMLRLKVRSGAMAGAGE